MVMGTNRKRINCYHVLQEVTKNSSNLYYCALHLRHGHLWEDILHEHAFLLRYRLVTSMAHSVATLAHSLLFSPDFQFMKTTFCLIISESVRLTESECTEHTVGLIFFYNFCSIHFSL